MGLRKRLWDPKSLILSGSYWISDPRGLASESKLQKPTDVCAGVDKNVYVHQRKVHYFTF